ncbi:MAG: hypothetical protein D6B25_07085, partial [Desulfobulbaceae bacterium]
MGEKRGLKSDVNIINPALLSLIMLVTDRSKRKELVLLYCYPFFCFALSHLFNLNTLAAVIIFYATPSCYLSLRIKKYLGKPLLFAVLAGVPFIIIIDHIANVNQEWV